MKGLNVMITVSEHYSKIW